MMTVSVKLHLMPNFNGGKKTAKVTLRVGATAEELLAALKIPRGDVGVIAIGDVHASLGDELTDGATVELYPIVAGG